MDEKARIDYFRSEINGEIAKLAKQLADDRAAWAERLRAVEERIDKMVREVKNLEMSVR